jgi:hypothetical protein
LSGYLVKSQIPLAGISWWMLMTAICGTDSFGLHPFIAMPPLVTPADFRWVGMVNALKIERE